MKEGIKLIAITGSMLALMATGVLAAANSDEGQAGGTKATKQFAPSGGMKAEGDGPRGQEGKGQTAMKGGENLKGEKGNIRGREGSTFSNERTTFNARTHRQGYAYSSGGNLSVHGGHRHYGSAFSSSGPEVDIYRRHHRHYIYGYNEPEVNIYRRHHRHYIYGYNEPSVSIHSHREGGGGAYVSKRSGGAYVRSETRTNVHQGTGKLSSREVAPGKLNSGALRGEGQANAGTKLKSGEQGGQMQNGGRMKGAASTQGRNMQSGKQENSKQGG